MDNWDVVYSYSRKQAIEDGVLVDVSDKATRYGFKIPVALTDAVYTSCVEWTEADNEAKKGTGQSSAGRLHDVLSMAFLCALQNAKNGTDTCYFPLLRVDRSGKGTKPTRLDLKLHIGPGDTLDPVLTILLANED
jgi:hypothetical protein